MGVLTASIVAQVNFPKNSLSLFSLTIQPAHAAPGESGRCPGQATSLTEAEIDEILRIHTAARAEVNLSPLIWNCKMADFSQKWVDQGKSAKALKHSSTKERRKVILGSDLGENLASAAPKTSPIATSGTTGWRDEKKHWDNAKKICKAGKVCGHYTQMVWRNTTEIGCGVNREASVLGAKWQGNSAYLACTYNPGGNYPGEAPY